MKASINNNYDYVFVRSEPDDTKIRTESQFFYHVSNILKGMGYDVVKREMVKDGHLTSDGRFYVRDRKWRFCVLDEFYELNDIVEEYNRNGSYQLTLYHF